MRFNMIEIKRNPNRKRFTEWIKDLFYNSNNMNYDDNDNAFPPITKTRQMPIVKLPKTDSIIEDSLNIICEDEAHRTDDEFSYGGYAPLYVKWGSQIPVEDFQDVINQELKLQELIEIKSLEKAIHTLDSKEQMVKEELAHFSSMCVQPYDDGQRMALEYLNTKLQKLIEDKIHYIERLNEKERHTLPMGEIYRG